MKISQAISNIIRVAEEKFGISDHNNDNICIFIYVAPCGQFQVGLERPTQYQLDQGEVLNASTIKQSSCRYAFFKLADTLPEALTALHQAVEDATEWDFNPAGTLVQVGEEVYDAEYCDLCGDSDCEPGCQLDCCTTTETIVHDGHTYRRVD